MTKETHIKGGYILALILLPFVTNDYLKDYDIIYRCILLLIYIYFAYLGSLSPDIDMRGSYISKRFPTIYKKLGNKFKHRGFTHSLVCVWLICSVCNILVSYTYENIVFICASYGFILGYISHICLDLITKEGVELFYPVTVNFSILPIKTSSKTERIICKVLNLLVLVLIGYNIR